MEFNKYQEMAHGTSKNTSIMGSKLLYPVLGLGDESGEVLGKVKKRFRDDGSGNPITDEVLLKDVEFKDMLQKELGDILWYVSETAFQFGISLEDIAQGNIDKLYSRMARGVIAGSGDNR